MTRRPPCAVLPAAEQSAYGQGYERMRVMPSSRAPATDRHGLAVVALHGVTA